MGDVNFDWSSIQKTATRLWEDGWSIVPTRADGSPAVDAARAKESPSSRLELDELELACQEATGLSVSLISSFNGDLACSTFSSMKTVTEATSSAGSQGLAFPVTSAGKESGKDAYRVFWLLGEEHRWLLDERETEPGRYDFKNCIVRFGAILVPIPPTDGWRWLQEPVTSHRQPAGNNLLYFDPVETKLIPELF